MVDFITLTRQEAALHMTAPQLVIVAPDRISPGSAIALIASPAGGSMLMDTAASGVAAAVLAAIFTISLVMLRNRSKRRTAASRPGSNSH
jgi:mannitol-specific phosphotransferase system IIBC component